MIFFKKIIFFLMIFLMSCVEDIHLTQWSPTFFDAFLPLILLELFIPPLLYKALFIPPLLQEPAGIFDLTIYSFSPAFYLSRSSSVVLSRGYTYLLGVPNTATGGTKHQHF